MGGSGGGGVDAPWEDCTNMNVHGCVHHNYLVLCRYCRVDDGIKELHFPQQAVYIIQQLGPFCLGGVYVHW